jgi:hypothetical protein
MLRSPDPSMAGEKQAPRGFDATFLIFVVSLCRAFFYLSGSFTIYPARKGSFQCIGLWGHQVGGPKQWAGFGP